MSSPPKEKSSPSLSPGSRTSLLASLSAHKPVLSPHHQLPTLSSPLVPHKPVLSPTPLPHKPVLSPTPLPHKSLVSPQSLPHKPLISHPQLLAKAVCRLCGELYSSYVELWAHVTTAHASSSPLSRASSQIPATTPTSILSNSALPYPLPILPLNLGLAYIPISNVYM